MGSKYAKLCTSTVRLKAKWYYGLLLLCLLGSEGCRIGDKPSPPHRHATSEHELGPVVKPRHSLAKAYASVVKAMGEDDVHHHTCLGMDRCSIEIALSVKQLEDLMRKVEQIGKGKAPSSAVAPSGDKNWSAPLHRHATSEHELCPDDKSRQRLAPSCASIVGKVPAVSTWKTLPFAMRR